MLFIQFINVSQVRVLPTEIKHKHSPFLALTSTLSLFRLCIAGETEERFIITEIYIFLVFILSSFLQTVTGFGYAIITAPLLALVLGAKETVMLVMLTGFIIRLFLVGATRNQGSYRTILFIVVSSILGAIPGAYVMTRISNDSLKLFIGFLLLLFTGLLWKNVSLPLRQNKFAESLIGLLSGFLSTTTGINGPPVVLYYLNAQAETNRVEFRANLTRYFLLINIASIIFSSIAGTLNFSDLWLPTLLAVPALAIGFFLGERLFAKISATLLRKSSLVMILLSSLAMIWSVLAKS